MRTATDKIDLGNCTPETFLDWIEQKCCGQSSSGIHGQTPLEFFVQAFISVVQNDSRKRSFCEITTLIENFIDASRTHHLALNPKLFDAFIATDENKQLVFFADTQTLHEKILYAKEDISPQTELAAYMAVMHTGLDHATFATISKDLESTVSAGKIRTISSQSFWLPVYTKPSVAANIEPRFGNINRTRSTAGN